MKRVLLVLLIIHSYIAAWTQNGTITGKIIDAKTGEELIGATVLIDGSATGTITDFDGKFTINISPGIYTVNVSYISYESQSFTEIEVKSGEITYLNVNLGEAVQQLDEVKIVARSQQKTEMAMQVLQRKSAVVLDGISAQQISRMGDSDAAGALKRVTGVSVLGGKYVFVRGLSERYMKITLNGAEIPGLDPDVNTVQMDLFPSNILENMVVHKTFSPELPTFTGGHVNIVTKDFPEKQNILFSASFGFNPQSNLINNFLSQEQSSTDWLGFDDGSRDVPELVKGKEWEIFISNSDTIGMYSKAFSKHLNTKTKTSFLDQSYSLSYGNSYDFLGGIMGLISSVSYKKEYTYFEDGKIEQLSRNASTSANLIETYGNEEVIWSAMLGLTFKFNTFNKIGITSLRNQSGASAGRYKVGNREIYPGGADAQEISPEYLERSITAFQLNGKHIIPEWQNVQIDWFGSYTYSTQNEPDMRFWYNTFSVSESGDTSYNMIPNTRPLRYYRYMDEWDFHGNINFTIPAGRIIAKSKLKFGGDFITKERNSEEFQYTLKTNFGSAYYDGNPNNYIADERLLNAENAFQGGSIYYSSTLLTNDVYSYYSEESSASGYIMLDIPSKIARIVGGIKYEYTNVFVENLVNNDSLTWSQTYNPIWNNYQLIKTKYKKGEYVTKDLLPSVNLTFLVSEKINLRLNYWKSISKPALREIAPLSYYDFLRGIRYTGDENLERSINFNYDFRFEYFFKPGELFSISTFFKKLQDPIEVFAPETAENIEYKYRNGSTTNIFGLETEIRKSLDFLSYTKNIQVGLNLTLVYSQIDEEQDRLNEALQINPDFPLTRPMFGQAPYSFNSYLTYNSAQLGLESNLAYNINGPKLIIISQSAAPNIYEMPFHQLDFNISKRVTKNMDIKFAVKNIMNQAHKTAYINHKVEDFSFSRPIAFTKFEDELADFRSYKTGTEFSIGFSLKF